MCETMGAQLYERNLLAEYGMAAVQDHVRHRTFEADLTKIVIVICLRLVLRHPTHEGFRK